MKYEPSCSAATFFMKDLRGGGGAICKFIVQKYWNNRCGSKNVAEYSNYAWVFVFWAGEGLFVIVMRGSGGEVIGRGAIGILENFTNCFCTGFIRMRQLFYRGATDIFWRCDSSVTLKRA